jgi:hypothetical protein
VAVAVADVGAHDSEADDGQDAAYGPDDNVVVETAVFQGCRKTNNENANSSRATRDGHNI